MSAKQPTGIFAVVHEGGEWMLLHIPTGKWIAAWPKRTQAKECVKRLSVLAGWNFADPTTDEAAATIAEARAIIAAYRQELEDVSVPVSHHR